MKVRFQHRASTGLHFKQQARILRFDFSDDEDCHTIREIVSFFLLWTLAYFYFLQTNGWINFFYVFCAAIEYQFILAKKNANCA